MRLTICENCNKPFVKKRSTQTVCGRPCRIRLNNRKAIALTRIQGGPKTLKRNLLELTRQVLEALEPQGFTLRTILTPKAIRRATCILNRDCDSFLYLLAVVNTSNLIAYKFPYTRSAVTFATIEPNGDLALVHFQESMTPNGFVPILFPKRISHPQKHLDQYSPLPIFSF